LIYHFTPFFKGDISEGINRSVEAVPDDAWICIRDADTMFLTWKQQWQLEEITQKTDFGLLGCLTNRCYPTYCMYEGKLSENYDILYHVDLAKRLEKEHWGEVEDAVELGSKDGSEGLLYGQFLLFPKKVWKEVGGFQGHINHDFEFSRRVLKAGHRLGVATGVYIFHAFRPGVKIPWFEANLDASLLDECAR